MARQNPIGYNIVGFLNSERSTYPKWIVDACDRIADKPDNDSLTNVETDALIRYLHGDNEIDL